MTRPVLPPELTHDIIAYLDPSDDEELQSLLACGIASKSSCFQVMTIILQHVQAITSLITDPENIISLCIQDFQINFCNPILTRSGHKGR